MITNQITLRKLFWEQHPNLVKRRHRYSWGGYSGDLIHHVDTRTTWVMWLDQIHRDGEISRDLMNRARLSRN